eukprot:768677-Hanusia_phi.AAC.5
MVQVEKLETADEMQHSKRHKCELAQVIASETQERSNEGIGTWDVGRWKVEGGWITTDRSWVMRLGEKDKRGKRYAERRVMQMKKGTRKWNADWGRGRGVVGGIGSLAWEEGGRGGSAL